MALGVHAQDWNASNAEALANGTKILDNDYVFDKKRVMDSEEGRSLPATEGSVIQTIGFNTQSSHPVFDEQNKPVLLMENGEDFSTLENIPAIRRSTRNEK